MLEISLGLKVCDVDRIFVLVIKAGFDRTWSLSLFP